MSNFLNSIPEEEQLVIKYADQSELPVNSHIHTPFSFSAFDDLESIFKAGVEEKMAAIGINDFFVTDGYPEFAALALKNHIFPMFNIEFISLLKPEQQAGIRINDPNNPGRCYFCGKGLDYPFLLPPPLALKLDTMIAKSQEQVMEIIHKCNVWFSECGIDIRLRYDEILRNLAKNQVRERHIAKAIRQAVFNLCRSDEEKKKNLSLIFGGKAPVSSIDDLPAIDNEIRGILLKSGGKAFVEENDGTFMSLEEIIEIILAAGGIPCYPVLLDDKNGKYTEYERDPGKLHQELCHRNIRCIELIPGRNDAGHLLNFTKYFAERDYAILMGTEHNTPEMMPLTCDTRGKKPLPGSLLKISWQGACVVAAHQFYRAKGLPDFNSGLKPASMLPVGNAVIRYIHANHLSL